MNKNYQAVHKYDFLTKELLTEEYITNGLADKQIAEKYNMPSKTVVWRKRKEFDILNKYLNKSNKNAYKNRKFNISKSEAEYLKQNGKTFKEIAEYMGCSIIVAKRRFKELGLSKTQQQDKSYKYWDVEPTYVQKQLIIGTMLGDGCITKSNRYSASHSAKQREYIEYKFKILKTLCNGKIYNCPVAVEWKGKMKMHDTIHFGAASNSYLARLRGIFYKNKVKVFPHKFIMAELKEEGLAYWYMDDGYYKSKPIFCTDNFSYNECLSIVNVLEKLFDIRSEVKYINRATVDGRKKYRIFVDKKSESCFFALIRPHIIPSMMYKVDYEEYMK